MNSPMTNQCCAPYFPVADLEKSVDHYERVLGFHRDYVGGKPPRFAILSRDGLPIMLRRQEEYQMEEFAVRDREGYVLRFGQPLNQAAPDKT